MVDVAARNLSTLGTTERRKVIAIRCALAIAMQQVGVLVVVRPRTTADLLIGFVALPLLFWVFTARSRRMAVVFLAVLVALYLQVFFVYFIDFYELDPGSFVSTLKNASKPVVDRIVPMVIAAVLIVVASKPGRSRGIATAVGVVGLATSTLPLASLFSSTSYKAVVFGVLACAALVFVIVGAFIGFLQGNAGGGAGSGSYGTPAVNYGAGGESGTPVDPGGHCVMGRGGGSTAACIKQLGGSRECFGAAYICHMPHSMNYVRSLE